MHSLSFYLTVPLITAVLAMAVPTATGTPAPLMNDTASVFADDSSAVFAEDKGKGSFDYCKYQTNSDTHGNMRNDVSDPLDNSLLQKNKRQLLACNHLLINDWLLALQSYIDITLVLYSSSKVNARAKKSSSSSLVVATSLRTWDLMLVYHCPWPLPVSSATRT